MYKYVNKKHLVSPFVILTPLDIFKETFWQFQAGVFNQV